MKLGIYQKFIYCDKYDNKGKPISGLIKLYKSYDDNQTEGDTIGYKWFLQQYPRGSKNSFLTFKEWCEQTKKSEEEIKELKEKIVHMKLKYGKLGIENEVFQ